MGKRRVSDFLYIMAFGDQWRKIGIAYDVEHRRMQLQGQWWPLEVVAVWHVGEAAAGVERDIKSEFAGSAVHGHEYFSTPEDAMIAAVEAALVQRSLPSVRVEHQRHNPYMEAWRRVHEEAARLTPEQFETSFRAMGIH